MTPQEILTSLSRLEAELQDIASARMLVEQTAQSYKDVQQEIRNYVAEFQKVVNSLTSIANSLKDKKESLSNEANQSITILKAQLSNINDSLIAQCNNVVTQFAEGVGETISKFASKTERLSSSYAKNNYNFESSIKDLAKVNVSIIKASESVLSLKEDIATLQIQLNNSQSNQDAILERIASDIQSTGARQTEILSKVSGDLKLLQDAQDEGFANIRQALALVCDNQQQQKLVEDQVMTAIQSLRVSIESQIASLDSKTENVSKNVKIAGIIGIVNIIGILGLLILLFVK